MTHTTPAPEAAGPGMEAAGPDRTSLLPYQIVNGATAAALSGIVAVLGELRDELGFSDGSIGVIVSAGFFASFVAQITMAPLADRGHGRIMAACGVALSAVCLMAMTVADAVSVWMIARAVLGFAGGLILPGIKRAAAVLDPPRAGENLGKLVVSDIVGFITGPLAAATLAQIGGVRLPFLVFGIGMATFLPFTLRLPADRGAKTDRVRQSWDLLRIRRLQGALLLVFGYFLIVGAFEAVLPLMFQDRGGSAMSVGIAFTIFGIPVALVSTHAGRLADRVGAAKVAQIGMGISAAASTMWGFVPGIWPVVAGIAVVAIADGYGFTAGQVAVARSVRESRQAGALGLMGASQVLAAGLAAIPAAAIYESSGAAASWLAVGCASLLVLALASWRLRGTSAFAATALPPV